MQPGDLIAFALLLTIPIAVLLVLRRPSRAWAAPRRDGPLGAVLGGLALVMWITYIGPEWAQPFLAAAGVLTLAGLVWHLARTVRRLSRTSA
jgi:hypothetical protein